MPAILPVIPTASSTPSKLFFFILTVTYINPAESRFFIDFPSQFVLSRNHKGTERLILGRRRHVAGNRQMGQEPLDLRSSHVLGVLLAMKQNIPSDPVAVGRLGTNGIVFPPDGIPDLVEQLWGSSVHVDLLALGMFTNAKPNLNESAVDVNIKIVNSFTLNGFFTCYRSALPFAPNHWTGIFGLNRSPGNDRASPIRLEC